MATTTPLNGWPVPTSTDYVKDGATAIEALGDAIDASTGKGLLAWQTYAPTLSGGWANGNGVWSARYCQIGKTVHVQSFFTVGSTTTRGTNMFVSLPVTAQSATNGNLNSGYCVIGSIYNLNVYPSTTTTMQVHATNSSFTYAVQVGITSAIPATWATGSTMSLSFTYEAA